jgi:hypothetical protein
MLFEILVYLYLFFAPEDTVAVLLSNISCNFAQSSSRHHLRMLGNICNHVNNVGVFPALCSSLSKLTKAMRALHFDLLATVLFLELILKLVLFGGLFPPQTANFSRQVLIIQTTLDLLLRPMSPALRSVFVTALLLLLTTYTGCRICPLKTCCLSSYRTTFSLCQVSEALIV